VTYIANQLAALHDMDEAEFAQQTTTNALTLFGKRMLEDSLDHA
jgi:Tat protein secretion system quality control protein TatD with DNase activity